jgi:DNA-binding GntR family transcriptional regulator
MLVTASLSDQIRSAIIRRIVDGSYAPGERLVELKLAAEFGVSQAPVREAFRQLAAMNFLSTSSRRGTYVGDVLGAGLVDLFVARGGLEETATRVATPLRAGEVGDLKAHVESMRAAAAAADIAHLERASVAFHRTIMEASRNRLILRLWSSLLIEAHTDLTRNDQATCRRRANGHRRDAAAAVAAGQLAAPCVGKLISAPRDFRAVTPGVIRRPARRFEQGGKDASFDAQLDACRAARDDASPQPAIPSREHRDQR